MHKQFKKKLSLFWQLGRYHKLEGAFLLFWPCCWGLFLFNDFSLEKIKYLIVFLFGALVMRGAGCTLNDIVDVKVDREVERTKLRPLASKSLSLRMAILFLIFQLLLGLIVVSNLSTIGICLSFFIVPFVFVYPFLKRFSYYPQVLLGLIFNWGIIISYYEINSVLDLKVFLLYIFGVLLTIGYDTIYGFQDFDDDIKINIKSLSIKVHNTPKTFVLIIYAMAIVFLYFSLLLSDFQNIYIIFALSFVIVHFSSQIKKIKIKDKLVLNKIFLSNVYLGLVLSIIFLLNNLHVTF